jgi:glycosyltransferase involved in cell wall biosynthesis
MKICIFVNNDLINDPRVTRHAEALGKMGNQVVVVCTKSTRTKYFEKNESYSIVRVDIPEFREIFHSITSFINKRFCQLKILKAKPSMQGEISGIDGQIRQRASSAPFKAIMRSQRLLKLFRYVNVLLRFCGLTWKFTRIGRSLDADVYLSNDLDTLVSGVLCAYPSKKSIHDAHELWIDQFVGMGVYPTILLKLFSAIEYAFLRHVNIVITVNDFIAQELERRYNIRRPQVILNVPKKASHSKKHSNTLSPKNKKIALYQGGYLPGRGLENLIRACEFLYGDVMLVMRGFGDIESKLRQLARPFKNCVFDPPVPPDKLVSSASSADVGIAIYLPINMNNYFASPNKLFEYIQAGVPIVASDLPFLRKIVAENEIGYLFDPRCPKDIARAINFATRDEILQVLRENVRRIRDKYCWENEQRKLIKLFNELIKEKC